jgi:hypothetical protein
LERIQEAEKEKLNMKYEVLKKIHLKISDFWDAMGCRLVNSWRSFEGLSCTLFDKMKALRFPETSRHQHHIQEEEEEEEEI